MNGIMKAAKDPGLKRIIKRIIISMLLGAGFLAVCPATAVRAEEYPVEGTFINFEHIVSWEYTYSDEYFRNPSDRYDHDLARLSLGMALAAFRDTGHPDAQDDYLREYLQNMGFSQIETETYRTDPTADSVGYGLAVKKTGDVTVLACAVCGGNYKKEWASNLTVGDFERSKGFQDSSLKVQAAIADYVDRNLSEERVKLWIAGFSRGGAVANITAADCTGSGRFEDVYAYTFATPRTTRKPVAYPNIFNIMQKEDVVPKLPLADWGYERFGRDLFLISPETDSDFADVLERTSELYRDMIGSEMVISSEINYQLRILGDYLLALFPDPAVYTEYFQPLLIDIMTGDEEAKDALIVLLKALNRFSTDDPAIGRELKGMRDYLGTLINVYYLQGTLKDLPPDHWDPQLGLTTLFNAHFPFEYLAMMYSSDDPEILFTDNTDYIRLVIYGDTDILITDGEFVLKEILPDGTELVNGTEDPYSFPDADCYKDRVVITFPADRQYTVAVVSESLLPQTVSYTGLRFSGRTLRAQTDDMYSYIMKKGDTAVVRTSTEEGAVEPSDSDLVDVSIYTDTIYSPTTAMRLENNSVVNLTISGLVNRLLLVIVILIVQMIVSIVLAARRKKNQTKRNAAAALIWHGAMAALFVLLEVSMWYFVPVLPLLKMIPGILVFVVLFVYAMKGCLAENRNWKTFWTFAAALAAFEILESLLAGGFAAWKAIGLMAVYAGFLFAAFELLWHKKNPDGDGLSGAEETAGS